MSVTVKIENTYEDGHTSVTEVQLPEPETDSENELEQWWEDEVFPHTGDGYGAQHPKLGVLYEATITAGPPELVGRTQEWGS